MNKNGVGMPTTKGEDREGLREPGAIHLRTKVYRFGNQSVYVSKEKNSMYDLIPFIYVYEIIFMSLCIKILHIFNEKNLKWREYWGEYSPLENKGGRKKAQRMQM